MVRIRRILCPVDFSATSRHALDTAVDLAKQLDAQLDLAHVYQLPAYLLPEGAIAPGADFGERLTDELRKQLDELVLRIRAEGVAADAELLQGVPHRAIVEHAAQLPADLVVMGTHGRTGLEHLLLGSVAERVVRTSRPPVLTVRSPS